MRRGKDLAALDILLLLLRVLSGDLICQVSLHQLFLLDDILEDAVLRVAGNRHVPVLFKFRVVAASFLRDAVAKETARQADILVLHRENLVEATQVAELVHATLVDLPRELLAPHLVPKQRALLVHLLKFSVAHDPVQVLLPVGFCRPQNLESVKDYRFLDLVVQRTVSLKRRRLVHFQQPRLCVGVDEHIEAEHLKAHVERAVVRLAGAIVVQQVRLDRDQRLDDQVSYF